MQALQGVGNRAFSRWLTRDYRGLFPRLPERPRSCASSQPIRTGPRSSWPPRPSPRHVGARGDPSQARRPESPTDRPQGAPERPRDCRWATGLRLTPWGVIVAWAWATAPVGHTPWAGADATRRRPDDGLERHRLPGCRSRRSDQPHTVSARRVGGPSARGDGPLHAAARLPCEAGDASGAGPLCRRVSPAPWPPSLCSSSAKGVQPNASGFVPLSIAEFSL